MTYEVVPMKPAHLEQKAYVHFKSWQETYRGLMPDGVLSHHTLERCRKIAEWCGENTFVAVCNGKVVGFARYEETSRDCPEQQMSEIGALYVLGEYQGYGIGRALLERCLQVVPYKNVMLWVLKGNQKAIAFYEHMGFCLIGQEICRQVAGGELTELEMVRKPVENL